MPFLKESSRSAAISFSPVGPYIAAGTVAGVIDMSFSTTSVLEVFLSLPTFCSQRITSSRGGTVCR